MGEEALAEAAPADEAALAEAALGEAPPETDLPPYDDLLPPYEDLHRPETLYLVQRLIRGGGPDGPALYELSHHADFLADTDRKVDMEKLTHSARARARKRPLFALTHRELANFDFQAEAQSRLAPPHMAIERHGHRLTGGWRYRVVRCAWGADNRLERRGPVLLEAARPTGRSNGVLWEWTDGEGRMLAREVAGAGARSLAVTAEMSVKARDALAAAWVLRIWWESARKRYRGSRHF